MLKVVYNNIIGMNNFSKIVSIREKRKTIKL